MSGCKTYLSSRNIPLIYIAQPRDKPILTLENYGKWYGLELVHPDGTVTSVDSDLLTEINKEDADAMFADHMCSPRMYWRLISRLDAHVCYQSLEMVIGRWITMFDEWDDWPNALCRPKFGE